MENYAQPDTFIEKNMTIKLRLKFPFLWKDTILGRAKRAVRDQHYPMLLSSFKAHLKPINSIEYISESELIIRQLI